jgi:hypothetical protein
MFFVHVISSENFPCLLLEGVLRSFALAPGKGQKGGPSSLLLPTLDQR